MAKKIILQAGRTFQEFALLPGHTSKECTVPNISLETRLADNLTLKIPLLSAAMTSVTGYEMALALGKEGGLGVLPIRLPIEEQVGIIKRIKHYEMGFVEEPVTARENETIEEVLRKVEKHGHTRVPIVDRNNTFLGIFEQQHYWTTGANEHDMVTEAMISPNDNGLPTCRKPDITIEEAKQRLKEAKKNYLVILDDLGRLVKLAFKKDTEKIKVSAAIPTHEGWKQRVAHMAEEGADLIVIDTSDAYNDFAATVIKEYKALSMPVPLCAGNVVTYEGAFFLMDAGADIVKVGMSSGSICITAREKAVGRAPMTALMEADRARREYRKKTGRYVPLVMDGGITGPADMIIALTIADAIMMGGYFNQFYEAASEKLDEEGKVTTDEGKIKAVMSWGEGSRRAQNFDRYGLTKKTYFEEGVEAPVPYCGRLKPRLKIDLVKVRAAMSNVGAMNLKEFREKAILELNSQYATAVTKEPHSIVKKYTT